MLLSVVIVSYNSRHVLEECLELLQKRLKENFKEKNEYEVIVVDNNSIEEERAWLRRYKSITLIELPENIGFGRANNEGFKVSHGRYILTLNSDVMLREEIDFKKLFEFLEVEDKRAALSIYLKLPHGGIDPAAHRGFPTPLNSLFYMAGLEKLTARLPLVRKIFGGYHQTWKSLDTIHEIDTGSAAFMLFDARALAAVKGFDPDYFFYAEDIDLCYRLKERGYSIWFYPYFKAVHLKNQSGIKSENKKTQEFTKYHFFTTMLTFYDKHYAKKHSFLMNLLVRFAVKSLLHIKRK
jgi:GT2 family glycosyltransferase